MTSSALLHTTESSLPLVRFGHSLSESASSLAPHSQAPPPLPVPSGVRVIVGPDDI